MERAGSPKPFLWYPYPFVPDEMSGALAGGALERLGFNVLTNGSATKFSQHFPLPDTELATNWGS